MDIIGSLLSAGYPLEVLELPTRAGLAQPAGGGGDDAVSARITQWQEGGQLRCSWV